MRTDDFLADLGEQLRTARPRRDLRPALALAVLAVLALAALAHVPRGEDRDRPAPAAPTAAATGARIAVLNGTTMPDLAGHTVDELRRAGYRVQRPSNYSDQARADSAVMAAQPHFGGIARSLARRLGITRTAPASAAARALAPSADVVVLIGADRVAKDARVSIVNGTTRAWAREVVGRLEANGIEVTRVQRGSPRFRTRVAPVGPSTVARRVGALLHADVGGPVEISHAGDIGDAAVFLGEDLPGATALQEAIGRLGHGATCRPATPARRAVDPFGDTRRPTYVCFLPDREVYDVQVLSNGSFVAERRGGGKGIYGSGARP